MKLLTYQIIRIENAGFNIHIYLIFIIKKESKNILMHHFIFKRIRVGSAQM